MSSQNKTKSKKIAIIGLKEKELSQDALARIKEISLLDDVERVVALEDLNFKKNMEAPSSFAVATKSTIYIPLSSTGLNCGMGVIKTSLNKQDLTKEFFDKFFQKMKHGKISRVLLGHGIRLRKKDRYDLTKKEILDAILNGPENILKKFKFPSSFIEKIENGTGIQKIPEIPLNEIIPRRAYTKETYGFGEGFFGGNHFIEFQVIDEIIDRQQAQKLGLKKDQVMIMYHNGGGMFTYYMGKYYSNRTHSSKLEKLQLFLNKAIFHYGSIKGIKNFRNRKSLYFSNNQFIPHSIESEEGKRVLTVCKLAMNYGYAFRLATLARIRDRINEITNKQFEFDLITDLAHNSIREEEINGEKLILHRHNSNIVLPGKPVILTGMNYTSSYLCIGMPDAYKALYSSDHGAGSIIKKLDSNGELSQKQKDITYVYSPRKELKEAKIIQHKTDEGINKVVKTLESAGVLSPVVRLKPLAVLKD